MYYVFASFMFLICILSIIFSRFYIEEGLLQYNQLYYSSEYIFEIIAFWKLLTLVLTLYVIYHTFYVNQYDYFILKCTTKTIFIVTKLLYVIMQMLLYVCITWGIITLIPLFLTPYVQFQTMVALLPKMCLFALYYASLMSYLLVVIKHFYSLLGIMVGYLIVFLLSDYSIQKHEVSLIYASLNTLFIDINQYSEIGYDFLFGSVYALSFTCLFIILCIKAYISTDT